MQLDGKIIAAGVAALVRYNPNGSVDTTFAASGILIVTLNSGYYYVTSIAIQPNGKILAAGYGIVGAEEVFDFATARYNADGSRDATFGTNGTVITDIGSVADGADSIAL